MKNAEASVWMRKIHRLLREKSTVEIVWMPDASGSYQGDTECIFINPFFEFTRILIHEAIHGVAPDMPEHEVMNKEAQLISKLSDRQILHLIRRYFINPETGEAYKFKRTRFGEDLSSEGEE